MGERSVSVDGAGCDDIAAAGRAESRGEMMLLTSGGLALGDMAGTAIAEESNNMVSAILPLDCLFLKKFLLRAELGDDQCLL
jgi:hypothetical protein